jgi:alpha-galactosidase
VVGAVRRRLGSVVCALVAAVTTVPAGFVAPAGAAPALPSVAEPPPMGWNSWNSGIPLTERNVEQVTDAMVASGMRDAGYRYVNLDAGWAAPRRAADGSIQADPRAFPHGMAALARYLHERGMRLGLYSSPYNQTCGQDPGNASLGHEAQDARTFAAWGVDYLKYDWCSLDADHAAQVRVFTAMRDALRATGRRIVYSINPNSSTDVHAGTEYDWRGVADLTRVSGDLIPLWANGLPEQTLAGGISTRGFVGVTDELAAALPIGTRTRPGRWIDPDMLVVGVQLGEFVAAHASMFPAFALRGVLPAEQVGELSDAVRPPASVLASLRAQRTMLTAAEQRTHFALWAMLAAPLIAGNDVRDMTADTRAILTNRDIIAVDQDPLVVSAHALRTDPRVLDKPMGDGSAAVALVNSGENPASITTSAVALGLPAAGCYTVTDLWSHRTTTTSGRVAVDAVAPHDAAMLRVTPHCG